MLKHKPSEVFPPLSTWQVYHSAQHQLGIAYLQQLHKKSPTQIYRWARDPATCEDVEHNPLDTLTVLLDRLCEIGRQNVARSAVSMLAQAVGCELACRHRVAPDQISIEAECLDDYPALTAFHAAIREKRPTAEIRHLWQGAKHELDETFAAACPGEQP